MVDLGNMFMFILAAYVGLLSWLGSREIKRVDKVESKLEGHNERIQSIEDIQGIKLDTLEKKIDKIEQSIEALAAHIHKEKNMEGQLNTTLKLLLEELTIRQDKREREQKNN